MKHALVMPWWHPERKDPGPELARTVQKLFEDQSVRYRTFAQYANVYEYGWRYAESISTKGRAVDDSLLSYNRAANAIDTHIGQVCAAAIFAECTTDGGTYEEQQQAEEATRALRALFEEVGFDRKFEFVVRDAAAISGNGILKVYPDFDACAVVVDRVPPFDFGVADEETRYGAPRCFYQRMTLDRWQTAELYSCSDDSLEGSMKKRREAIFDAPSASASGSGGSGGNGENVDALVDLYEGHHLPSRYVPEDDCEDKDEDEKREPESDVEGPYRSLGRGRSPSRTSGDGRHAIGISNYTLRDDGYTKKDPPYVVFCASPPAIGFWGRPIMRMVAPGQRELEALDERIQRANRKLGGAHLIAPKSAGIAPRQLSNGIGTVLEFDDTTNPNAKPPFEWTPTPVNPQTYEYRERLAADMLRFIGQNQLSAQGQVPAGLRQASGRALQAFIDEGATYLGPWLRERQRVVVRCAELMLDAVAELVKRKPNLTTRYQDGTQYKTVEWRKILEMRKRLVIRATPINPLTMSVVGKQSTLDAWLQAGAIDARKWRNLGDTADLRSENAIEMSWDDLVMKRLSRMVREGEYADPSPFCPLGEAKVLAGKFHDMCEEQGVDDTKLVLIRRFIAACDRMSLPKPQAQPPADMAAIADPAAQPMPAQLGNGMPL